MSEIVFRGKRVDNGEWIEGGYFNGSRFSLIVPHIRPTDCINKYTTFDGHEVIRETVGQSTGLKDKNGETVFEGDILKIEKVTDSLGTYYDPPAKYPLNVVVKWDMCAWEWETTGEHKLHIHFPEAWCHYQCEIIGNIHDNPELIGGSEK